MIRFIILFLFFPPALFAQKNGQIAVETKNFSLLLNIGTNHRLYQGYLGRRLDHSAENAGLNETAHEAYVAAGMENQFEPALRMVHADGNPSVQLNYITHSAVQEGSGVTHIRIVLRDPVYPVEVTLHYVTYFAEDVIKSWTEISQQEKSPVELSNYASSMLHFDASKYWITEFEGSWSSEANMHETELKGGIKIVDSKLGGTRTDMFRSPFFQLSLDKPAQENTGDLIAGTLAWSGNWQFLFEIDEMNSLRVISGMNPYASVYKLVPGQTFLTPEFIFTFSHSGRGQASRNLHQWARKYGILDGSKPRLTLLNNWEATKFNFDQQKIAKLFEGGKQLGIDAFLLDDGWFGSKYPRNDDKAGLGDWQEDRAKLPNGIGYLIKEADKAGLKFGIWLEPEMVNPKSELYEKHPDWLLKLPNRDEHYSRNQLVLDLINPKVQDYIFDLIDGLLTKNPGLAYIKWDCNRSMTNTYSPYLKEKQSNLFIDYTRSFYKVLERLRIKYTHLPMMLCSGGGSRADYGGLKYFTELWPSDNTDGLERVYIQWGFSQFFPSITLSSHVTDWGTQSLKFRTDVAMMGKLGYDIKVSDMNVKDLQFSHDAVSTYKRLSDIIWFGDQYRLISPYDENRAVLLYADSLKNKVLLFNYILNSRAKETFDKVKLQGLDPNKTYLVTEINLFPGTQSNYPENGKFLSGDFLMKVGLTLAVPTVNKSVAPLTSAIFELTTKNQPLL